MKRFMVRLLWWLATFWLPSPPRYFRVENALDCYEVAGRGVKFLAGLVYAYQKIFSEPPWSESFTFDAVTKHLRFGLTTCNGRLAVKNAGEQVVGVAWAAAFPTWSKLLEAYLVESGVDLTLTKTSGDPKKPLLFVFELAALKGHRGLLTIRELVLPLLLHFHECGGMVYWTNPTARTYHEAFILGAAEIWRGQVGRHEIVFFYLKDVSPLRKAFYHFPVSLLARFVHTAARTSGLPPRG